MISLASEAKARLMAYPYTEGHEPISYSDGYFSNAQKAFIKPNQQFFFDNDFRYSCSGKYTFRLRGVLQTRNNDGTTTEQDVEFGFDYGTPIVPIGEPSQPSRLFEGNDFIELSAPVSLKKD